jgi:GT2 family glycosyltransferase
MESQTYKPKVMVAILHQGYIRPELASLVGIMKSDSRATVEVAYSDKRPSENNRNFTCQVALNEGYDYFITIDHDIVPTKNPIDLALLGLDVVGFACPQWNMTDPSFPIYLVGMDKVDGGYEEHKDKNGLQEVDAVGSGCLCINTKVLKEIKAPFVRKWDENGMSIVGLDFYFCEKAKEKGFKIYCHYDYLADHFKEVSLLSVLRLL